MSDDNLAHELEHFLRAASVSKAASCSLVRYFVELATTVYIRDKLRIESIASLTLIGSVSRSWARGERA